MIYIIAFGEPGWFIQSGHKWEYEQTTKNEIKDLHNYKCIISSSGYEKYIYRAYDDIIVSFCKFLLHFCTFRPVYNQRHKRQTYSTTIIYTRIKIFFTEINLKKTRQLFFSGFTFSKTTALRNVFPHAKKWQRILYIVSL